MKKSCYIRGFERGRVKGENINQLVILNWIQDLLRLPLALKNSMRVRFQIKFGMTPLLNDGAFTLIEILVVVLIIGILAAIALPQYQRAVLKARVVEVEINLRAMYQSIERYYLENGRYPIQGYSVAFNSLSDLDIVAPACKMLPRDGDTSFESCSYEYGSVYGAHSVFYARGKKLSGITGLSATDFFIPVQDARPAGGSVTKGKLYTLRSDHDVFGFTERATTIAGKGAYVRPN